MNKGQLRVFAEQLAPDAPYSAAACLHAAAAAAATTGVEGWWRRRGVDGGDGSAVGMGGAGAAAVGNEHGHQVSLSACHTYRLPERPHGSPARSGARGGLAGEGGAGPRAGIARSESNVSTSSSQGWGLPSSQDSPTLWGETQPGPTSGGVSHSGSWQEGAAWLPWALHCDPIACMELDVAWGPLLLLPPAGPPLPQLDPAEAEHWRVHVVKQGLAHSLQRGFGLRTVERQRLHVELQRGGREGLWTAEQGASLVLPQPGSGLALTWSPWSRHSQDAHVPFSAQLSVLSSSRALAATVPSMDELAGDVWWCDLRWHLAAHAGMTSVDADGSPTPSGSVLRAASMPPGPPPHILQRTLIDIFSEGDEAEEGEGQGVEGGEGQGQDQGQQGLTSTDEEAKSARGETAARAGRPVTVSPAPLPSLPSRLALHALLFGNPRAVALLWRAFLRELRFGHWETLQPLPRITLACQPSSSPCLHPDQQDPGLDQQGPDLNTCLLHQKLQVLQVCILRRLAAQQCKQQQQQQQGLYQEPDNSQVGLGPQVRGVGVRQRQHQVPADAPATPPLPASAAASGWEGAVGWAGWDPTSPGRASRQPRQRRHRSGGDSGGGGGGGGGQGPGGRGSSQAGAASPQPHAPSPPPTQPEWFSASEDEAVLAEGGRGAAPRGVKRELGSGARLKRHPTRPIHIPITQALPVYSEDRMMERAAQVEGLLLLSSASEQGVEAAARVSSEVLVADMAAFKAANPGAVLEDFLRWYSPKDVVQDAQGQSLMSKRMQGPPPGHQEQRVGSPTRAAGGGGAAAGAEGGPGPAQGGSNLWQQLWASTPACPAWLQRPLQDAELEGERVLHDLDTLAPLDLFDQLLALGLAAATQLLGATAAARMTAVAELHARFHSLSSSLVAGAWRLDPGRHSRQLQGFDDHGLEFLLAEFDYMEQATVLGESVLRRLPGCPDLCEALMQRMIAGAVEESDTGRLPVVFPRNLPGTAGKRVLRSYIPALSVESAASRLALASHMCSSDATQMGTRLDRDDGEAEMRMLRALQPEWPAAAHREWVLHVYHARHAAGPPGLCSRMYVQQAEGEQRLALTLVPDNEP